MKQNQSDIHELIMIAFSRGIIKKSSHRTILSAALKRLSSGNDMTHQEAGTWGYYKNQLSGVTLSSNYIITRPPKMSINISRIKAKPLIKKITKKDKLIMEKISRRTS